MQHTVINSRDIGGRTCSMEKSVTKMTGEILEGLLFLDFAWLNSLYP